MLKGVLFDPSNMLAWRVPLLNLGVLARGFIPHPAKNAGGRPRRFDRHLRRSPIERTVALIATREKEIAN
jgi:hypothetical protein